MYRNQLTFEDKVFGQHHLSSAQAAMIKKTYLLLGLSVLAAMAGAVIGSSTPALRAFFGSWVGWIVAMVGLNALPAVAMAFRRQGALGLAALLADGFFAGIILGPIIYMAERIAPDVVTTAMIITGIIFLSVTGYVATSGRTFSAPRGLMTGIFFAIVGITLLNLMLGFPLLSLIISAAIGIFGLVVLIYATSDVLNNPEADSPIPGALMLFAGLFQVFQAVLHILMAFTGRDD